MLKSLPIALVQVKAANTSEDLLNLLLKTGKSYILRFEQKKLLKKHTTIK